MQEITPRQVEAVIKSGSLNKKLVSEIRLSQLDDLDWENLDFFTLTNKSGQRGLLFYQFASDSQLAAIPYSITPKAAGEDGRNQAIICDICRTWQKGSAAGFISLENPDNKHRTTGFYVCLDLKCSLHIRDLTPNAKLSRSQVKEDIDTTGRIARLQRNLGAIMSPAQNPNNQKIF